MEFTSDLYKWNKNESKLKAKIKESNSIQTVHQWLRKVENVTDNAINQVFKTDYQEYSAYTGLIKTSPLTTNALSIHTDTYTEANELLNKWVGDKVRLDFDQDFFNYIDINEMNKFEERCRTLDDYNPSNRAQEILQSENLLDIAGWDYDKYDQEYVVDDLMKQMSKKKYVDTKKLLKNSSSKTNVPDIRTKIELRHQQVKENREKRAKEAELKRKETFNKKEAELEARRLIQKEEQQKKLKANIEQQLLAQEIEKLRKEMNEQKRKEEEVTRKNRELELIRLEKEKKSEVYQQRIAELSLFEVNVESKRRELEEKHSEQLVFSFLKAKSTRKNQLIFSAWYGLILDRRLKLGKAKALFDWKIQYKLFNGWKKEWINSKVKKDQEAYDNLMKIENIKISKAKNYYKLKLLSKCTFAWKNFTRNQILNKKLQEEKCETKSRIEKFLEAAAQGKLATAGEEKNEVKESCRVSNRSRPRSAVPSNRSTRPPKPTTRETSSARVTREDDLADNLMLDIPISDRDDSETMSKKVRKNMWPWVKKSPFMTNNYENRYKAHEKLLHEQQKMIKEQQRVIEEMRYEQNKVAFKEQVTLLEQIKTKQDELEKMHKAQYKQEKQLLKEASMANEAKKRQSRTHNTPRADYTLDTPSMGTISEPLSNRIPLTETSSRTPEFLKNMQERAKLREQMRRTREEKKKLEEFEKLKQQKAQHEEKLKQDEEEKRKRLEILKEKRRVEREMREKRETEEAREVALVKKADDFYRLYILRHYCMNGLKRLLEIRDRQMSIALNKYKETLKTKVIHIWQQEIHIQIQESNKKAHIFYCKYLLNIYFKCGFKRYKQSLKLEESKAARHYKYHMKCKLFSKWKLYKNIEKQKYIQYDEWINKYYIQNTLRRCLLTWKAYPSEMRRQRDREKRLQQMRNRVLGLVPDFAAPSPLCASSSTSTITSAQN